MKNAIIVHGCSSSPHEEIEYDPAKHWMPWVRDELITRGIPAVIARMPESWAPDYNVWENR